MRIYNNMFTGNISRM